MKFEETFGTDKDLEEKGKWFDIGGDARVCVARFGNTTHKQLLDQLRQPYKGYLLRNQDIPEEANEKIVLESMAASILVGWEGMYEESGKELMYSKEAALFALSKYRDFRDLVSQLAMDAANFRSTVIEETAKK